MKSSYDKENKKNIARELKVLRFMKKTDVLFYHHAEAESMKVIIKKHIKEINTKETTPNHFFYDNNSKYTPRSLMSCKWNSNEFQSIYDVPLDGSYHFYIYDSGARGLGASMNMSVKKVDEEVYLPSYFNGF